MSAIYELPNQDIYYRKPGEPCEHPGCASHLSHPCEGCGRYAAGLNEGPDVDAAFDRLREMSLHHPIIASYLKTAMQLEWTREQMLFAMVFTFHKTTTELSEKINEVIAFNPLPPFFNKPWQVK